MPQLHQNILPLSETNYPGCLHLDLISSENIPAFQTNKVAVNSNLMSNPSNWQRITPKARSLKVSVKSTIKDGVRLYQIVASGIASKTTVNLTQKFFTFGYQRFCALVTTQNGNHLLIGSKQFPALLLLKKRKTGSELSNPNDVEFEISVTSKNPLFIYTGAYVKPTIEAIAQLSETNYPGCKYMDVCPSQFMMNYSDSNFFVNENIMNNYDFWTRIYFKNASLNFTESIEIKNGSRVFVSSASGEISKPSEAALENLFAMGYSRFVAIVTDRNNNRHIVGAPAEPALLTIDDTTTGEDNSVTPGMLLNLQCQRNRPSKTYQGVVILPGDGTEEGDGGNLGPISSQNAIKWPDFTPILWPDLTEIEWQ